MLKWEKKLLSLFVVIVAILLCIPDYVSRVFAIDSLRDNFDLPDINTSVWQVLNETNVTLLSDGLLNIRNIDARRSAFLQNIDPIVSNDNLEYFIRFKFNSMGFGSGIALNDNPVNLRELNVHPGANDWTVFVWPTTSNSFKVFTVSCPIFGPCLPTDNPIFTVTGSDAFEWHTLSVRYIATQYHISLDDQAEVITQPTSRPPTYVWIGNPMITNGVTFANFLVDFIKVESPLILPTFPFLSQKDSLWGSHEYDSASQWAGLDKSGIDRWGCALTSVAMLLQHYGVKTPEGGDVNPDNLNTWLKGQPDGYIGPGLLNWIAITRYAKDRVPGEKDSLEFVRSYDKNTVELPSILGIPGHFVLAHDQNATSWVVNDPANSVGNTELPYTSNVVSINHFVPSNTDLSYMLFVADPGVTTTMKDPVNNPVEMHWADEYLSSDLEATSSSAVKTSMIAKPAEGQYSLRATNTADQESTIKIYLYDPDGGVTMEPHTIPAHTTFYFFIYYSRTPGMSTISRYDYTSILSYLQYLRRLQKPANGIYQALTDKFRDLMAGTTTAEAVNTYLLKQSPRHIPASIKTQLQSYIELIGED